MAGKIDLKQLGDNIRKGITPQQFFTFEDSNKSGWN